MVAAGAAEAQVTTYTGHDASASTAGANSMAAQSALLAATGGAVGITFESGLPSGVAVGGGAVTNSCGGPSTLFGGNTTLGGEFFLCLFGGQATFTFTSPISYFGAYFGGVQLDNQIQFVDANGAQNVMIPFTDISTGGFSFAGFTSAAGGITSVTINAATNPAQGDIISVDDVIYGVGATTTTPEPSTWALTLGGVAAIGGAARRRRRA